MLSSTPSFVKCTLPFVRSAPGATAGAGAGAMAIGGSSGLYMPGGAAALDTGTGSGTGTGTGTGTGSGTGAFHAGLRGAAHVTPAGVSSLTGDPGDFKLTKGFAKGRQVLAGTGRYW